jgi:hypothetical protein
MRAIASVIIVEAKLDTAVKNSKNTTIIIGPTAGDKMFVRSEKYIVDLHGY